VQVSAVRVGVFWLGRLIVCWFLGPVALQWPRGLGQLKDRNGEPERGGVNGSR
jgi:hypothetical protein